MNSHLFDNMGPTEYKRVPLPNDMREKKNKQNKSKKNFRQLATYVPCMALAGAQFQRDNKSKSSSEKEYI